MSNYIAQSTVLVRADTSPFRAQLERAVKQADNKKIVVKVVPTTVGFVNELNRQLRELKGIRSVPVKVTPDLTGFRSAVRLAAIEAVKDLNIPVGVAPAAAATRDAARSAAPRASGVATGGVVDKRVASAQLAIATATDAGIAARRRFDSALSDSEKQMLRDTRVALQLKTATEAVTAAVKSGSPALQAQAENLHLVAAREDAANQARKARATARAPETRAAEAEAAAAAETKKADEIAKAEQAAAKTRLDATTKFYADRERASNDAIKKEQDNLKTLVRDDKAATAEILANRRKEFNEQLALTLAAQAEERKALGERAGARATRTQVALGAGSAEEAFARNQALEDSAQAAARAEADFAQARQASARATVLAGNPEKVLAAARSAERAATNAVVESQIALNAARDAGFTELVATRQEELKLAATRLEQAAATTAAAEAEVLRAGRIGAARRAFEAFGAQLAGLRGAALSAQGAFLAAGAAAILLTKSVQSAARLETSLNTFKVVAGATADEMERVSDTARALGADITLPGVNANQAADALTDLSKAGLSVNDSLDAARGTLQLATAASIDQAQATELVASALNAFSLNGKEASRVADLLAGAANESQGSISDIGVALQQSAAAAAQAGVSVQDTVTLLTELARAGLRGSDAGTSLRTALIRLINPSKKAQEALNKLNVNIRDANGNVRPEIFSDLSASLADLTKKQRDATLAVIFGQDAFRAAAILGRQGAAGFNLIRDAISEAGLASQTASARTQGFEGQVEALKNSFSNFGITVGNAVIPGLEGTIKFMDEIFRTAGLATGAVGGLANALLNVKPPGDSGEREGVLAFLDKLAGIKIPGTPIGFGNLTAQLKEFNDAATLVQNKKLLKIGEAPSKTIEDINKALLDTINNTNDLQSALESLSDESVQRGAGGGAQTVADALAKGFIGTNAQIEEAKTKLAAVARLTAALGRAPTVLELEVLFDKGSIDQDLLNLEQAAKIPINLLPPDLTKSVVFIQRDAEKAGSEFARIFNATVGKGLDPSVFSTFTFEGINAARQAAEQAAQNAPAPAKAPPVLTGLLPSQVIGQIGGFREKIDTAAIKHDIQGQLAGLRELRAFLFEQLNRKDLQGPGRDKIRRTILAAIGSVQGDIKSIFQGINQDNEKAKSEVEKNKKEAQANRDKADQALLDALSVGRTSFTRAISRAQVTPGANDNVKTLLAFRKRLQDEVKQVTVGIKDAKTRATELQRLSDELFQNSQDINAARKTRDDAIRASLTDRGTAIQSLGETTGNFKLVLKGLDLQIKAAKETLVLARAAKTGVDAAKAALAQLTKSRRDAVNEARNSILDQGFALAEAKGNKSAMLQIIDLQIAQARLEEKQAKTLLDRLVAQTKVAELINKKKEILNEEVEKGAKGTSAFDLLKEFSDRFNDVAGNLINADQPFAGPTGFTADIAQFLKRRKGAGAGGVGAGLRPDFTPGSDEMFFRGTGKKGQKQEDLTTSLIAALEKLTAATLAASGNDTTTGAGGKPVINTKGNPWAGRRWFVESHAARGAVEG